MLTLSRALRGSHVLLLFLSFSSILGCVETLVPPSDGGPPPGSDAGPTEPDALDSGDAFRGDADRGDALPPDAYADAGPPAVDAPADSCVPVTFFADADMDGFGDATASIDACTAPDGYVTNSDDCDDGAMGISPDATERCDFARVDENCSGAPNEGCECDETMTRACPGGSDVGECIAGTETCSAAGTWGVCVGAVPPAAEICDGEDDDCDGGVDGASAVTACGRPSGVVTATCGGVSGCAVGTCVADSGDCNVVFSDGCETPFGTLTSCTMCGDACGWDCMSPTLGCNDAATGVAGGAPIVGSSIAPGLDFTCTLREDGTVVCWGSRAEGRLGDAGSMTGVSGTPVVVSSLTGATAVAAGSSHACALRSGTVVCWGDNDHGQLGDGTIIDSNAPVTVRNLSNAIAIDVGDDFSCALRSSGRVACWGSDVDGRLGNGAITGDQLMLTEASVIGVSPVGTASAISLGDAHACAIVRGGALLLERLYCWGRNASGQVGDGTLVSAPSPVDVSGGGVGYALVAAGGAHSCAMRVASGVYALRCWGENGRGQLGDGTIIDRPSSVAVSGLARVTHLSAGGAHTCARLTDTSLRCWGAGTFGQLGDLNTTDRTIAATVLVQGFPPTTYMASLVTAGAEHTCAVEADGTPTCWGSNGSRRIGAVVAVPLAATPLNVPAP